MEPPQAATCVHRGLAGPATERPPGPEGGPGPYMPSGGPVHTGLQGQVQGLGAVGQCQRCGLAAPAWAALAGFAPRPGGSREARPLLDCRWPPGDLLGRPSLAAGDSAH